jgi:dienelactone hydrolase
MPLIPYLWLEKVRGIMRSIMAVLVVLVAGSVAFAKAQTKAIAYRDGDTELEGFMAWDDSGPAKRPGVLVIHEWWGLNDYAKKRAEQLASMGYVAFALDMYGKGKVTVDPKQAGQWAGHMRGDVKAWMSRAMAGLGVLKSHENVDTKRLAAIGYCFGGTTAMALAFHGEPLAAVVSFHGALPAVTPEQAKATTAKVLICHGANDAFIPDEAIRKFRATLDTAGTDYTFVYYSGAVHSFTVAGSSEFGVKGVAYHKPADQRSWAHMKQMFDEVFARE